LAKRSHATATEDKLAIVFANNHYEHK